MSKSLKQPALAGALPGVFVALTGGKPLEGFDIKRPIVITFHVDGKGEPLGAMVAVPVEGKEKFQKTLDAVFPPKTSPKGKAYEIPMLGKSVYAKPGERYFLLSDVPALVAAAKADPPDPVAVADVAIESLLDAVPEELRAAALAQFESGFDASMAGVPRDPTTPPAQAEAERRSQEATAAWVKKTVRSITTDGDRSTVEVNLDPETKRVSLAVSVRARPGTALAEGFASYGAIRPGFAAAGDADALAWVGVSSPTGEWLKMALGLIFESGIEGMKSAAADAAARGGAAIPPQGQAVLDGIEKASRKMMATPNLEVEVMVAADGAGKPRIVSRTTAEGATDLFAALAKIGGLDPAGPSPPDADGVMAMPVPPGAPPSMGLLDVPVRVASGGSSVVMGFGCADNAPVKKLLTAPGTAASAAPVSAWVDVAKLWPIVVANDPGGLLSDTADAVGGEGMFRLDLGALKDGIELRLNVDDGVLQLLGRVAEKMAAPPGGAGGPGGLPGRPGGFPGQPGGFPGGFPGPTP